MCKWKCVSVSERPSEWINGASVTCSLTDSLSFRLHNLQNFAVVFFLRILFVASFGWLDGSLCSCLSPQCQHVDMWDVTSDSEVAWWELFSVLLYKIGTVTGGLHEFPTDSGFFNIKRQYQHYCKVRKKLWFQPELAIHRERKSC